MPDEIEDLIMQRLIAILTHHNLYIDSERTPPDLPKRVTSTRVLKGDKLHKIMHLFYERLDQIELSYQQRQSTGNNGTSDDGKCKNETADKNETPS